ncbi:carbohydrate-binding protein [Pseudoflavitalea sp. X16]|uniref:glycosyl hydrolase family 18 protein n=1 Tax=Paraflavitalea devenefica TaxID=2716334 RepID=UPI001422DA18|nr:glycosyl hydrolase family 18 protein [Paraflavitalea devenefica]NII28806.1 carbohydrate-binding protein [Paraflavitalea devenefica]
MKKTSILLVLFIIATKSVLPQFKVVGYMPSWAGNVNSIQYSKLTHINYAFLLPTATGGLQAIENPSKLQSLVSLAHANGKKVLIAVGGWNNGDDGAFESLAANSTYRNSFVNNMINFVNQYNLDGIDIDWEYPDNGASANNYATLMQQLSTEMHNRGKLLTAAVVGINGASILNSVFNVVDFLNLMAYDFNNFDHSTYSYATQSINYWKGRGLPASKVVLGVPFYGRPSWESFATLVGRGANPYADVFSGVGYNGITTIKSKTNLAFDQGNGIMMWELSQDATGANSLLSAIHEVVLQRSGGGGNPITIQAENYSNMQGIQTEACTDAGGGQNVGWIDATDWMAYYNINFPVSGTYKVEYRVASLNGGGTLSLDLNAGTIQLGALAVPSTGGWQNWTTITHNVYINAGTYNVGVYAQAGGWNLNWLRITPPATGLLTSAGKTTDGTISDDAPAGDKWVLYPNPVQHQLNIQAGEDLTGGTIRIVDITGRQVLSPRAATYKVDVSSLAPGMYTLIFTKKDKVITKQFIK